MYFWFNFLTGHWLDGVRRSNATWTRRGTVNYVDKSALKLPSAWHRLPRLWRMAARWGVAGVAVAVVVRPAPTLAVLAPVAVVSAAGVLAWVGWTWAGALLLLRHRREWVWPLHTALHDVLGIPALTNPSHYLVIPPDFTEPEAGPIQIGLPADFKGTDVERAAIPRIVKDKLALTEVVWRFVLDGRNSLVTFVPTKRPPLEVMFANANVRAKVARVPESAPLIGLTTGDTNVSVDLDAESPHVLISAGTGGGKSVILRAITAQLMHYGALVDVLDRKRHSHGWIRGIDGVRYHREIKDIHDGLVALGREGERRNMLVDAAVEAGEAPETADVGPRHVILLEEANATIGKLKRYWTMTRDKDDPKESPAIEALGEILFMGRAVKMHVLLVAQSATAAALGGPEMRENFATRILARYTQNAFKMLAPEIHPAPKSTRHIGRAQVVLGGTAHETQVLFFTDAEAAAWATSGVDRSTLGTLAVTASQATDTPDSLGKEPVTVTATAPESADPPHLRIVAETGGERAPVTLREALDTGVLQFTGTKNPLAAARRARATDPEFPAPVSQEGQADLYDPDELERWERNRPGTKRAEGDSA